MSSSADEEIARLKLALAKREWLLDMAERHRALAPRGARIETVRNLGSTAFLEDFYAAGRPVVIKGELDDWPALSRWNADYLKAKVGSAIVEYQGERTSNPLFEIEKHNHRRTGPFDAFIDGIRQGGAGNEAYITAYNSDRNQQAFAPLVEDVRYLDKYLTRDASPLGFLWIGPADTVTSLHHDLTNNFILQLTGRKRLKIIPATEVAKLYNHRHVFSEIVDLEDPTINFADYPRIHSVRGYEVVLEPGDILFMPLAWWHQVKSLDFSVTATLTNFLWPNDGHATYPNG